MNSIPLPRALAAGRLAVRKDPRPHNPNGWAIVSNEPCIHWSGRRRVAGEYHAGLYAYRMVSWKSAVRIAHREALRRTVRVLVTTSPTKVGDPILIGEILKAPAGKHDLGKLLQFPGRRG